MSTLFSIFYHLDVYNKPIIGINPNAAKANTTIILSISLSTPNYSTAYLHLTYIAVIAIFFYYIGKLNFIFNFSNSSDSLAASALTFFISS